MKTLITIFLSLTLTAPAWADYSGSVSLDWTSLTFSATVDLIPRYQQQSAAVYASPLQVLPGTESDPAYYMPATVPRDIREFSTAPDQGWVNSLQHAALPVGEAISVFEPAQLSATINLHAPSFASSSADLNGFLVAHETGLLTTSIAYHFLSQNAGESPANAPFGVHGQFQLIVTDHTGVQQADVRSLIPTTSTTESGGVLRVTNFLTAGVQNFFTVSTELSANQPTVKSVPIPDLLWPTVLGLIGLAGLVAWRRKHAA